MKKLKLIGGFCYIVSFFFASSLFLNFNIGISNQITLVIFLSLGAFGFLLNLISFSKDKTGNPISNLTYWLGSFLVFAGLVFHMLGFPISISFILIGSAVLFLSLFVFRKRPLKDNDEGEILDQF